MSAPHGTRAVATAFITNAGVAIVKLIGWALSGSAALFSEALHSIATAVSQLALLLGRKSAKTDEVPVHPLSRGNGDATAGFVTALVLLPAAALLALVEGVRSLQQPGPVPALIPAVPILLLAIIASGFALRVAWKALAADRAERSADRSLRTATQPALALVVVQQTVAVIGPVIALGAIVIASLTGNAAVHAIGTILIGVLLLAAAGAVGALVRPLLIGEASTRDDERRVLAALDASPEVEAVIHLTAVRRGASDLTVGAKIAFPPSFSTQDLARAIGDVESQVRVAVPEARAIYIEPDIFLERPDTEPSTDHIVIQSGN